MTSSLKRFNSLTGTGKKLKHSLDQRQLFRFSYFTLSTANDLQYTLEIYKELENSLLQIRSHAQKYFLKVQKNGTAEHLPPPRPKRKAAHPYPQKASKNSPVQSQVSGPLQSSSSQLEPGHFLSPDTSSMLMIPMASAAASSCTNNVQTVGLSLVTKGPPVANNGSNSTESTPKTRAGGEMTDQGNLGHLRVLPDFGQVYSFIGSVFDPNVSGHLQKLRKMDQIDVETVLLLMRNLSINLSSPDFEDHRRLLSSYEIDTEMANYGAANNVLVNDQQCKNVA
ncbi:protein REVEILLE 6-like isoform X2 [Mangifera indica]|uniref:protein REVEILLE 6-like isoform X2 n=1 Tax=Mangifera indica TaxID=29780 RepID=UPI001CF9602B|nr:protein REVEILLE 6-like isoform X2 [Mangifera indica]